MSNMVRFSAICVPFFGLTSPDDRPTAQMIDGLEQVRNILGNQEHSGCSDQSIKDALWEFFFDVDKSVVWLLGAHYPPVSRSRPLTSLSRRGETKEGGSSGPKG